MRAHEPRGAAAGGGGGATASAAVHPLCPAWFHSRLAISLRAERPKAPQARRSPHHSLVEAGQPWITSCDSEDASPQEGRSGAERWELRAAPVLRPPVPSFAAVTPLTVCKGTRLGEQGLVALSPINGIECRPPVLCRTLGVVVPAVCPPNAPPLSVPDAVARWGNKEKGVQKVESLRKKRLALQRSSHLWERMRGRGG